MIECVNCAKFKGCDLSSPNVNECADYKEQMTNEEWLHTLNTEQLAEVLNKIFMTRTFCHICPEGGVCDIGYECKYHGGNTKDFVEWLKQPHTKE